jgi:signal transduction histidine kinase/PAS domain-containing protein
MSDSNRADASTALDALNQIPSGVGIFDVTGTVIEMKYVNDGFYRMIGSRREERTRFFHQNTIQSVHPEDRTGLVAEALAAIRENRMFEYQFRNLDGSGNYLWIGIRASHKPLDEHTERFYASYYNVDPYVLERDKLKAYGSSLDAILGNIPGGVAVFSEHDGQVRLTFTNAGFFALHHGSREYWSAQSPNPVDWLVPEDRHLFWDEFRQVLQGRKEQGSVVYRITGEDGEVHWVSNEFRRAYQQDGVQFYYASFIDMDRQVAAEQEILRDKQMYEDATQSAKLIIWSYDVQTHRAAMLQSGYTGEVCSRLHIPHFIENVAETIAPYVSEPDRPSFLEAYRRIDSGAEFAEAEFHFRMPGQESLQQERMSLKRFTDEQGRLLTVYCCGQNVTEEKEREESYEQIFRQLDKAYPHTLGSFRLNLTRNWCGNGRSSLRFVLKQQQEGTVDGYFKEFAKLIADEDIRQRYFRVFDREGLLKKFAEGISEVSIEYPIVYADGKRHWRKGLLFMLKNPRSGDVEAVTYALDIDEQKKTEFVMQRLIHDHFDYIAIIHPDDRTFEFRSRIPDITFGSIGERLPYKECEEHVRSLFERPQEIEAYDRIIDLDAVLKEMNEKGSRMSSYLRTENGRIICTRLQYSWLENPGGDILVVRSDVTEAYEKEQEQIRLLEQEKHAAEAASIAKSEFLSRMSHDIRTPLNGIIGMTYLAQEQPNPERTTDCLNKIDTSSKFLLSLINDILDMSKAESGKIELRPEPYPADEFGNYVNAIITPLCQERSQTFRFEPVEMLTDVIPLFDKLRINQIVFNLLSNAVKYTPEGGRIRYRIFEKRLSDRRMSMHIDIIDNGIGMSEEFQKILFDPFTQEGRSENSEMHGTGLGLAITKRLIDAMGGTIRVSSALGKGTTFLLDFTLDCIPVSQMNQDRAAAEAEKGTVNLAGRHLLICEDHPLNQEIVKMMLEEKQALVTAVSDGQEGVRAFQGSSLQYFDCILMDIHMPVMDGYEAARTIRALQRPDAAVVPIIAMTADAFQDDVQKCLNAGMNGHIAKPINPEVLFETLQKWIR